MLLSRINNVNIHGKYILFELPIRKQTSSEITKKKNTSEVLRIENEQELKNVFN